MAPGSSEKTISDASLTDEAPRRRRRRSSPRSGDADSSRSRLGLLYFSLASIWGFLIGTVALLFGFSLSGQPIELSPVAIAAMAVAVAVALSFGLGGREAAGKQMEYWLARFRGEG